MTLYTETLDTLDEAIALFEADVPANPASPKNQKHERRYEALLQKYFQNLEQAFPYKALGELYNKFAVTESGFREAKLYRFDEETGNIIDPVLNTFHDQLVHDTTAQHTTTYIDGDAQMVEWGKTLGGRPIYYEGPPTKQAIKYAGKHCAELVKNVDTETKRRLARTISDGIANKRGIPGLATDIRSTFADMKRYRSVMIARTETCDALSQAFMDRTKALGVTHKEWIVTEPCEICQVNADKVVEMGENFPSGHGRPPAHPNCRCALAPVTKRGEPKPEPTGAKQFDRSGSEKWSSNNFKDVKFTKDELNSASMYQSSGSLNPVLRSGKIPPSAKPIIKNMDSAISKCAIPDNITVYRGVGSDVFPTKNMAGSVFTDKAYVSTSFDKAIGQRFAKVTQGNTVMEITVPKGTKGLPMHITGKGVPSESEMLLGRNTKFKITSDTVKSGKRYLKAEVVP